MQSNEGLSELTMEQEEGKQLSPLSRGVWCGQYWSSQLQWPVLHQLSCFAILTLSCCVSTPSSDSAHETRDKWAMVSARLLLLGAAAAASRLSPVQRERATGAILGSFVADAAAMVCDEW